MAIESRIEPRRRRGLQTTIETMKTISWRMCLAQTTIKMVLLEVIFSNSISFALPLFFFAAPCKFKSSIMCGLGAWQVYGSILYLTLEMFHIELPLITLMQRPSKRKLCIIDSLNQSSMYYLFMTTSTHDYISIHSLTSMCRESKHK